MRAIRFMNAEGVELDNGLIRAVALPEYGGKTASLTDKRTGFECLFQNPKRGFERARRGDDFSLYEACGFDDAFPTVDACTVTVGGEEIAYPDHGEIWSAAFAAREEDGALALSFESPLLGYIYEKRFSLDGRRLRADYTISNPTPRAFPALWTCHCLMRHEDGMSLIMPPEAVAAENAFTGEWLGQAGRALTYPNSVGPRGPVNLSRIPQGGQFKYYIRGPLSAGWCGYSYPLSGHSVMLRYDAGMLPYLGFWATGGGYRGDVNCALEPSSGYYDSIPNAMARGCCPVLRPGSEWRFSLSLEILDA